MANNSERQITETNGNAVDKQAEMAQRALNYRGRFGADQLDPKAFERQQEIDRVKG
jgi:hypothetical protein